MKYQSDPYKYEGQDADPAGPAALPTPAAPPTPEEVLEATVRAEFYAAWAGAARMVTVHDEDGGTSQELRAPAEWNMDGCRNVAAFLLARCPHLAAAQASVDAARAAARKEADGFASAEKLSGEIGRKARVQSLAAEVQRELPRWLRKLV